MDGILAILLFQRAPVNQLWASVAETVCCTGVPRDMAELEAAFELSEDYHRFAPRLRQAAQDLFP